MQRYVLLSVEQHGKVEGKPFDISHPPHGAEDRDHPEAGQYPKVLLIGVSKFAFVRRRNSGADSQVIENYVILGPRVLAFAEFGAQGFAGVNGHLDLLFREVL